MPEASWSCDKKLTSGPRADSFSSGRYIVLLGDGQAYSLPIFVRGIKKMLTDSKGGVTINTLGMRASKPVEVYRPNWAKEPDTIPEFCKPRFSIVPGLSCREPIYP